MIKQPANYLLTGLILIALLTTISSCARKAVFQKSLVVPAAKGSVKVKKDNNNNHLININISDLAEPARLQPPMQNYVVWMVTNENGTKNLGQIQTGKRFLSKSYKGSFKTVSSFKPVKIFITAENETAIQFPGMYIVLSTNYF